METKPSISVVIPVYNSESTLDELTSRLRAALSELAPEYEVILVNDGSRDGSWKVIQLLCEQHSWLQGINLMRNFGQHNALLCGVRAASNEFIVTMDDDLQHPPEEIHKLVHQLETGFDVVYGIPDKLPHSPWRNFFSRLIKRILAFVMGVPGLRDIGAFRAFRTDLRRAFSAYSSPHVILDVLLSWGTTSFGFITIREDQRKIGKSNYTLGKLVTTAIFVLTSFSTAPLRIASLIGFVMMLVGLVLFIFVIISYFTLGSLPGFPFLASTISLFSGTQLFALGIIGEYLGRIFDRSMERPQYVIGTQTTANDNSDPV